MIHEHTDHQTGEVRKLGLLRPTENCQRLRAASRSISDVTPIIPRSNWTECDYVTAAIAAEPSLILDQGQIGACVGFSCVGANALVRYHRTGNVEIPSGFYVYDQGNGGRDNGMVIADAQGVMTGRGAPPVSAYPSCRWRAGLLPEGVEIYREDESLTVDTPEEAATALISLGGFSQLGINVTNSFTQFTRDGVAWNGRAPGGYANHSIYIAGLKNVGGKWYFILVNSWRLDFGPFRNGTCLIPVDAIEAGWLHLSTLDSGDAPPVPVV